MALLSSRRTRSYVAAAALLAAALASGIGCSFYGNRITQSSSAAAAAPFAAPFALLAVSAAASVSLAAAALCQEL